MLNPMPRENAYPVPPAVDARGSDDTARARPTAVARRARIAARQADAEPVRDMQTPVGVVSAALFFVSGVALQEATVSGRAGYAAVGAMALAAALALPFVARLRKRG